ncbi:hypothetical protein MTO96_001825 [Rhipicephalus appendiculatus]
MSACCNLYTFLWRRLYLQTVRRHYLALLIEIIFVLVTFIFFLQNDRVDLAQVKKLNSSSLVENVSRRRVNRSKVEFREICVVYGPSNDRTDKLINKLLKITGAGPYVVIPASHDEPHKEPVPMDNILQSLSLIDHVHMLLQGNHEDTTMLYSVDMPISAPVNDIGQYRNGFFVATTVGFCLPLVWRVRDVTAEIGSGLKDLQEVMGISSSVFWIGHFLSAWSASLVEAVFAIIVTTVIPEKYNPQLPPYGAIYANEDPDDDQRKRNAHGYIRVYARNPDYTEYLQNADGISRDGFICCLRDMPHVAGTSDSLCFPTRTVGDDHSIRIVLHPSNV